MTPQQELDIYLGKTTISNDRLAIDLFVAPVIKTEPISTDTNVDLVSDLPTSNPIQETLNEQEVISNEQPLTNNEQRTTNNLTPGTKTYKKHFYLTLGIACILLLALIFKK